VKDQARVCTCVCIRECVSVDHMHTCIGGCVCVREHIIV
jgi:hypothetical protein